MTDADVRVVGPAAFKTLVAYGGTVLDTRSPEGLSDLPQRLARLAPDHDQLVLLLVEDATTSLSAARALQQHGYRCVVLVTPEPDLAAPAPDRRPG
jgi:hypothetical protein